MGNPSEVLYFYIGQAAVYLGVSIDTLRRWEEKGKLIPFRTAGGTRFYSKDALDQFKATSVPNPEIEYSISEAAQKLGISIKTLRRWDADGKLTAKRNEKGQRIYAQTDLQQALQHPTNQPRFDQQAAVPTPAFHKEPVNLLDPHGFDKNPLLPAGKPATSHLTLPVQEAQSPINLPIDLPQINFPHSSGFFHKLKSPATGLVLAFIAFAFVVELTLLAYNFAPSSTKQFFSSRPEGSPLNRISATAMGIGKILSPPLSQILSNINFTGNGSTSEPLLASNIPLDPNILGANISGRIMQINGDLEVTGHVNGLSVSTATTSGIQITDDTAGRTLTVTANDVTLDQNLSTASTPSFSTLGLSSTSNQLTFGTGNVGTLTWTPTATRTVTLPDATGTIVLDSATQTLTNKTMSGSSNTLSNIANSSLANSKVTVTAGTNMSGGGDVSLGSSVTLSLASSPAISGVLTLADGTAAAPALTFTSDTNTGLYRLGADKIGLITGGSATKGITIDSSGQLGVGTITPGAALEVAGQVKITGGTPGANKVLTSDADGLASWVSIGTAGGITGTGTSGYIPKFTSSSVIATSNLYDNGTNIGIGTTAPSAMLSVGSSSQFAVTSAGAVTMASFDSNAASTVAGLTVDGNGNLTVSNGALSVTAPSTTENAAAVAANSLTTGTALDITSTSTAGGESGTSTMLKMTRSGVNANTAHTAYGLYSTVTNTNVTSGTNIAGYFSASGATTANYGLIVNSGNVGIGTTAPASFKLEVAGNIGPEANNTRDLGSATRYFANAYVTNLKTGTSGEVGYWSRTGTTLSPVTAGDSISATGSISDTPAGNSTALNLTGTNVTSANLAYFNAKNTSGTIFNIAYGAAATLAGDLVGQAIDLNNGMITDSAYSVTGFYTKLPTITANNGAGTVYLKGLAVEFGTGPGIEQQGAGALTYTAADLLMPALTQTAGTLTANGLLVTTPSGITTGGTAYGVNISPTGVGAGTLTGVNIGTITGGLGTETAIAVGTGWDNVLKVGSTAVINGSGVVQVAAGGTGLTSYTAGDLIYASDTTTFTKLTTTDNEGKVLVVSAGVPSWGVMSGSSCTNCLVNNPSVTQTIAPTANTTTGLSIRQTSTALEGNQPDIFNVTNSAGTVEYFSVDYQGNVSTGAIANTTLTLTPTTDTTALTLVGTNVSTANLQYINAKNLQGTILNLAYGAAATLNNDQTLTGQAINLSTNVTANASSTNTISVTGSSIVLPGPTNSNTSGTSALKGLVISAGSGINQSGSGGTTTFSGADITIPALTQGAGGTLTANGVLVTTPSSITTGGTANGVNISASGIGAGILNGINIGSITGGAGTETALNVGTGWDYAAIFAGGKVGIGTTAPTAILQVAGNHSLASWTTNGTALQVAAATYTDTDAEGIRATGVANSFGIPTFAASNAVTITDAATVYIAGKPTAGSNMTLSRPLALWVANDNSRFGGNVWLDDGQYLKFGTNAPASGPMFGYRPSTSDLLFLGLGNDSGDLPFVIGQRDSYDSTNFAQTRTTNPTLYIQSAINPNVSNNEWGSFAHDQTGFVITTGANVGAGSTPATIDNYIAFAPRGTERVRFDGTGNVGIGDDSPDYLLELYDATNTPTFALSDDDIAHGVTTVANTDTFFHLSSISTTDGGAYLQGLADNVVGATALQLRGIQASDPTDTVPAIKLIGAKASGTGVVDLGAAETVFQVANNDDAAALTILGDGKMGIGTTAPTHALTLPSTSTGIALYNTADQTNNYERGVISWSSNEFNINVGKGGTGTSNRNLSITNPSNLTYIYGAAQYMRLDTTASYGNIFYSVLPLRLQYEQQFGHTSGTKTAVEIMPDVNLAADTTGSYSALDVNVTLTTDGSSGSKWLQRWIYNTGTVANITNLGGAYFAGNVGIGTTAPGGNLDVTNATIANAGKLVNLSGTLTTATAAGTGYGLYNAITNANTTNADTAYATYTSLTDAVALANTNYGLYTTVANTGAIDSAITKTIYGSYISSSGTGGAPTTAGTTNVYGEYITTTASHAANFGTVNQYGLYIADGTSSTNGTAKKYGLYVESPTGADNNYAAIFAGGNVGIGIVNPTRNLELMSAANTTVYVDSSASTGNVSLIAANNSAAQGIIATHNASDTEELYGVTMADYTRIEQYNTGAGGLILGTRGADNPILFGTNGAERMRLTSTGLGIGTTAPSSLLDITRNAIGVTQDNAYGLSLVNTTAAVLDTQQYSPPLRWRGYGWKTDATAASQSIDFQAYIRPIQGTSAPTGGLDFLSSINGGAYSNLLTILSGGNVGIGTTAPTSKLSVGGASSTISNATGNLTITPASDLLISAGNVGIGSTNPVNKLKVVGSLCVKSTDAACAGSTAGTIYATTTTIADADLAENYISSQTLEPGDIVSTADDGNNLAIVKSESSYQKNAIGVISTNPGVTMNSDAVTDSAHPNLYPVALAGRVPVKVSTENGPIEKGDFLTSSSTPGVAMKATRPGQMIGKALESFPTTDYRLQQAEDNFAYGKIMVFVNLSYADPNNFLASLTLDESGNLIVPNLKVDKLAINTELKLNGTVLAKDESSDILTPTYTDITTPLKDLLAYESTNSAQIANLSAVIASDSAAISTLSAQVSSTSAALAQVKSDVDTLKLTPPETLLATGSATLASINVTSDASVSGKLVAYQATISDVFKALGQTFLGNTTVAGDFTVDGTMSLTGNSLNAIDTLFIQNSPLTEAVDFFNGKVTIDKDGQLIAQTITASEYKGVTGKSVGSGIILAGTKSVEIPNSLVKTNSKILLTPSMETSQVLGISAKIEGNKFIVSTPVTQTQDLPFDWFLINEGN